MFGALSRYKVGFWTSLCLLTVLTALAGLHSGHPALAAFGRDLRPISPVSGWFAVLLCGGLYLSGGGRRRSLLRGLAGAGALAVGASLLHGILVLRAPLDALLAGIGFFAACLALGASGPRPASRGLRQAGALAALVPLLVGALFLFGYVAGMPLLYETGASAASLPTALALFLMGHALMALSGIDVFPSSLFHLDRLELASAPGPWLRRLPILSFMALASLGGAAGALWMRGQVEAQRAAARGRVAADLVALLRPRFWGTAGATLGAVLLLAMATGYLVRRQGGLRIRRLLAQEREHKALAQRAEVLMREANDIILLLDLDGRILEANERAQASYGYTLQELRGRRGRDLSAAAVAEDFERRWDWLKANGSGVWETWHRRQDGSEFPVEASSRVVTQGGDTYVISFLRDISERHAQAREIRHLTQLYAALGQVGQAVVWTRDRAGLFQRVCSVLVEFGRMGTAWIAVVDPSGAGFEVAGRSGGEARLDRFTRVELDRVVRDGEPCVRVDAADAAGAFPIAQDGRVTHLLVVVAPDRDFFGKGEVELLEETALDLSFALDKLDEEARRARAEEQLRTAEAFAENLIRTAHAIVVCLDEAGRAVVVNEAAAAITGYRREDLLDRGWFEALIPRDRFPEAWEGPGGLGAGPVPRHFESPILTRDGEEKFVSWQNSDVPRGSRGAGTIAFGVEITRQRQAAAEQKRLEAQLQQSQKMESLGSLAGGVAHDLNNVLAAILSLASAHRENAALPAPVTRALTTIVNACLRGRGVIKSLLYFARRGLEEERPLDLNALVADITQLLAHTTLKRIRPAMDLEPGLPPLLGDAGALSHAVMNLCVNAVDAMARGGTLTLRTRREPGGGLSLAVADTGEGMAREVLDKAMEPFFTTKPLGKGTGLGLSMVFGTMKAHGGTLELLSSPGQGTEAVLRFPASRVQDEAPAAVPAPPGSGAGRPMTILVVDDDDLVREAVGPMLEVLDHRVHLAPGGQEALEMLAGGLEPDVVILDMNMPGLTGAETLPRILALRPGQRVIMASGYSDQDVARLIEGMPGVRSLRKPFSLAEIKALLDEPGASEDPGH